MFYLSDGGVVSTFRSTGYLDILCILMYRTRHSLVLVPGLVSRWLKRGHFCRVRSILTVYSSLLCLDCEWSTSSPTAKRKSKLWQRFSAAELLHTFLLLNWSRVETIFEVMVPSKWSLYSVTGRIFGVLIDRQSALKKRVR